MDIRQFLIFLNALLFALSVNFAVASEPSSVEKAERLKQEIIDLSKKLYQFEEQLLYPTETQLAVFLSVANDSSFLLDSIELRLDRKLITSHLYKEKELEALKKGGIQRLYIGSLADGTHKLTARFNGHGGGSQYYRRNKSLTFTKDTKAKYIQLVISESSQGREPVFKVKQW